MGRISPMITLEKAMIGYGGSQLFPPLNGYFAAGSLTAVIGANGVGKSTLLKTVAGLLSLKGGKITFSKNHLSRIAYLPQQIELDLQFPIQVYDLVAMGNYTKRGMFGGLSKCASRDITESLECVGMTSMAKVPVGQLSSGQLQRALFARLLVQQAPVILLDEPFTGIDSPTTDKLILILKQLHQKGRTLITVLHDMSLVINHFSQVLMLTPQSYYWGDTECVLEHFPSLKIVKIPTVR